MVVIDVSDRISPKWLDNVRVCQFCGSETEIAYKPSIPNAAAVECPSCGAKMLVSPPDEYLVDGSFKVEF